MSSKFYFWQVMPSQGALGLKEFRSASDEVGTGEDDKDAEEQCGGHA